jgi:hypothetical protein
VAYYNIRDLIGHFVAPRTARGKMCPHACCRNKRVHPANMPVILPNKLLRRASDEDLAAHYDRVQGGSAKDVRARAQVLHEMDRRDRLAEERKRRRKAVAYGAYARRLEREEAVEHAYVTAERTTSGYMLNRKGMARGINPRSLFTGSEARARRYASEELLEHWQTHGRPTAAMFRGKDTRVHPMATEPKRRQYGIKGHPVTVAAARRRERQAA